jgi:5'-nucleotidase (lipoprotein e(P4) family)
MILRNRWVAFVSIGAAMVAVLAGCAVQGVGTQGGQAGRQTHELLNAVLWVQTSAEYEFACRQSFRVAMRMLDEGMYDPEWTAALEQREGYEGLPPAVILDVDETVLDNSPFEARLVLKNMDFNQAMWDEWVAEADARAMPGSKEFIRYAWEQGVEVFFVTNRKYRNESHTVRNLREEFGPGIGAENVLSRGEQPDWTSDKSSRRAFVAQTHRILLLIGDDFNDFTYLSRPAPWERVRLAQEYSDYWGTGWILLPNPMYGSWEQALYGYDRSMADVMKLNLKYDGLDPQP